MISEKIDLESKVMVSSLSQKGVYPVMKDSTKIVVMKVILRNEMRLSEKIATLVFGESVEIAPQLKQKRNVCPIKKCRLFAILIFRVYLF